MDTNALANMESLYMALGDKTRLRLLNLMRANEVCVCFFTEVLGDSQPKVSRHLAYLRNAGLVEARRDGKWMHYSIIWPEDPGARRVLESALDWLGDYEGLREDLRRYETVCCTPELLVQIAKTPIDFIEPPEPQKVERGNGSEVRPSQPIAHNELEEFLL
jgi:ArsR family transcriptional regulator, arsenate/arsenite/antimonite-responsive transcriptional repressor